MLMLSCLFLRELKGAFTLTAIKMLEVTEFFVGVLIACVPIGCCCVLSLLICIKLSSDG